MAGRWLFKTEPSAYSFADLERDRHTVWDGVKNALALRHLAAVATGDEVPQGERVLHPVPDGAPVALEVGEGVGRGLGLEQPAAGHQA